MIVRADAKPGCGLFDGLIIDLFAGGGGASTAIEQAEGRCVDIAINHDPEAIALHRINHPHTFHFEANVRELKPRDVVGPRHVRRLHASPDCFPAGTLILTASGMKAIESVEVGERVLTHRGRWRPVTDTMRSVKSTRIIRGYGHPGLEVSDEHPFYARQAKNVWRDNTTKKEWTLPQWTKAADLMPGRDYWATPLTADRLEVPAVPGRGLALNLGLLWLAGRYLADGWTRQDEKHSELVICCGRAKVEATRQRLDFAPASGSRAGANELRWQERETETEVQFTTAHDGLVTWLRSEFGHLAPYKRVPGWVYGLSDAERQALLDGYFAGDGFEKDGICTTRSISKALSFGMRLLVESLGFRASVYFNESRPAEIDGRKLENIKPAWSVRWRRELKRHQAMADGSYSWAPIREITAGSIPVEVFNISVDEDESYIADGMVVHNCKDFSKAKGGKPVSRRVRSLANVVIWWARDVRPDEITLENVEEFKEWGPLVEKRDPRTGQVVLNKDGTPFMIRDPKRKGQYFRRWVRKLEKLGYRVEWRELRACDYGAPTIRKRLFVVARSDGREITWPEATHGPVNISDTNDRQHLRDLSESERLSGQIRGAAMVGERNARPGTVGAVRRSRSGQGRDTAGADAIGQASVRGSGDRGKLALKPFRTAAECIDWSKPCRSIFGRKKRLKPNTERRIAKGIERFVIQAKKPFIVTCNHSGPEFRGQSTDEPMRTVTGSRDAHGIVAPVITPIQHYNGSDAVHPVTEPLRTVTAHPKGGAFAVTAATLVQTGYGERKGQAPRVPGLDKPLGTVVAGGVKHAAVAATLVTNTTGHAASSPHSPMPTLTTGSQQMLAAASLIGAGGAEGSARPRKADEPLNTILPNDRQSLVAALLTKLRGTSKHGQAIDAPAPTITAGGRHEGLTVASMIKFYGTADGVDITEPLHTITTKDQMGLVRVIISAGFDRLAIVQFVRVWNFLIEHLGPDAPAPIVEVDGEIYLITDIGMRMLMPRELYAAQGFPPSYVIEFTLSNGRRLSQAAQVRMCGNSVSPPPLEALVRVNGGQAPQAVAA